MAKIPKFEKTTTLRRINAIEVEPDPARHYLGMSSLGHECRRKIWFGWRHASPRTLEFRSKRIFERGDMEEERVIKILNSIGIEVYRWDEDGEKIILTGVIGEEQQEVVGYAKHCMGHTDGEAIGVIESPKTPHLLEIKTCNETYFRSFVKHGMRKTWPGYYGQSQSYMHHRKLRRGLFIVVNKNTEEIHIERLKYNKVDATDLYDKSVDLIMSENPPKREYTSSHYFCKWCEHFAICHYEDPPQMNCRTCKFCDVEDEGKWSCSKHNKKLSFRKQLKGCDSYRRLF